MPHVPFPVGGSTPTTIRSQIAATADGGPATRDRSMSLTFHSAPSTSSRTSPSTSCRYSRVPLYIFSRVASQSSGMCLLSVLLPRLIVTLSEASQSLINWWGLGVLDTTQRMIPRRRLSAA